MACLNRRGFLRKAAGATFALAVEEKALLAHGGGTSPSFPIAQQEGKFPAGKIKNLTVSRIICGGNLISGFAHSRDLIYVSSLLKQYFTIEKVCETLSLCEQNGVNTAILRVDSHIFGVLDAYWNERGGKIQWIAQAKPTEKNLTGDIRKAIDGGACAVYIHGGVTDRFVAQGKVDLVGKALEVIKQNGVPAGIAGHALATVKGCLEAGLDPDFIMKTLNAKNYWSATIMPRHDSVWAETPEETIRYMAGVKKPWIAYKVLGAGAIHPRSGFPYVFENGADFACVGMFDFQVLEDLLIARRTLSGLKKRTRPWCG